MLIGLARCFVEIDEFLQGKEENLLIFDVKSSVCGVENVLLLDVSCLSGLIWLHLTKFFGNSSYAMYNILHSHSTPLI